MLSDWLSRYLPAETARSSTSFTIFERTSEIQRMIIRAVTGLDVWLADAPRPYRVLGGMAGAWVAAVLTELFVLVTVISFLRPGPMNALLQQAYSVQSALGVSRSFFESVCAYSSL